MWLLTRRVKDDGRRVRIVCMSLQSKMVSISWVKASIVRCACFWGDGLHHLHTSRQDIISEFYT